MRPARKTTRVISDMLMIMFAFSLLFVSRHQAQAGRQADGKNFCGLGGKPGGPGNLEEGGRLQGLHGKRRGQKECSGGEDLSLGGRDIGVSERKWVVMV